MVATFASAGKALESVVLLVYRIALLADAGLLSRFTVDDAFISFLGCSILGRVPPSTCSETSTPISL